MSNHKYNPEGNIARAKAYYQANRQKVIDYSCKRREVRRLENSRWVFKYLLFHPCIDCGEGNPIVLEFDHKPGTKEKVDKTVCYMVKVPYSLDKIKAEVAKCDVRCANCHRLKTAREQRYCSYLFSIEIGLIDA